MMTQLLNPIALTEAKYLEVDVRYLKNRRSFGRIDHETESILYGNRLNRCNPANLSPTELKSKGYRDGFAGVFSSALSNNSHYSNGWDLGYADRQVHLLQQDGLVIVFGDSNINKILSALPIWEAKKLEGETVEIRHLTAEKRYVLCASVSLMDRELHF